MRDSRAHLWIIWGLIGLFGVVEVGAWTLAGGIPRRPIVLLQVVTAWIIMLVLALLATRRMKSQAQQIRAHEDTHQEKLGEIEQLQTQNAMLEIIARSVDATLAFQALASRIGSLVPCDRVGLALLSENGQEFQTYTARVHEEERRARPRPEIVFKVEQTVLVWRQKRARRRPCDADHAHRAARGPQRQEEAPASGQGISVAASRSVVFDQSANSSRNSRSDRSALPTTRTPRSADATNSRASRMASVAVVACNERVSERPPTLRRTS